MGFEVEIKFRVADLDAVAEKLDALGAESSAPLEQIDAYFSHPSRDFAQTDEAFRLRRIGDENRITYKGPKRPGPTKTREEIEVPFEPGRQAFEQMQQVLLRLGFSLVATIAKARRSFTLSHQARRVEVTLDRAATLGDFVEVETLANDESDLPLAQAAVIDVARNLGLTQIEPRSYLRMTLEQRGRPSSKSH